MHINLFSEEETKNEFATSFT